MKKKLTLAVIALSSTSLAIAQNDSIGQMGAIMGEQAFTFTEAQLGEEDNFSQNVTIINSNSNIYASQVGYLFSPVRFRYRAFNQKYNDVYINGAPMNDMETGQFRYSLVGGLNQQTRNMDSAMPFEENAFNMSNMAGSNNYDFRPANMAVGQRISLAGANRNYTVRGMYTYNSGLNSKGWAVSANVTYRWADKGYVEGTFYNALSYYLGVQKLFGENNKHSLTFATWGNPTERASQGASTDEMYWIANDNTYNPYWGYQNGKKRNSRIVNDFAPTALLTWDWKINDDMKVTTTLAGKYCWYSSTKLNYNNSDNPHPDYWKMLPSSYYDVWGDNTQFQTDQALEDWKLAYEYLSSSKANRQIDWDRLYYANENAAKAGNETMYYIQAKHNDNLNLTLSSTLTAKVTKNSKLVSGFILASNSNRHYQTLEDMLGGSLFHNINNYALGKYPATDPRVQYDLNRPNAPVNEGDKFGYDYKIEVMKGLLWTSYTAELGRFQTMFSAKLGQTNMRRHGYMRNGMAAENSYGNSGIARMGEGGAKGSISFDAGRGHAFKLGIGYEWQPPKANTAFVSPEIQNDFVRDLHDEHIFSSEFAYQYQNSWMHANLTAYYSRLDHVTEWQNFYSDMDNSFVYFSLPGLQKEYYGVELGLDFKLTSFLNFKAIGTLSDNRILKDIETTRSESVTGDLNTEMTYIKGMRESGTPLNVGSFGLSYHAGGWFIDLNANYYDRIYLSYAPIYRTQSELSRLNAFDNFGNLMPGYTDQAKGHGGWMVDGSIGKSVRLKHGSLNFNLMITNILNNQKIVSGGYEQSRSDFSGNGESSKERVYKFSKNPKKYYVFGTNGMFQVSYRF